MKTRSCYSCTHFRICAGAQLLYKAIKAVSVNIDGDDAPKKMNDVYDSFAQACLDYSTDNPVLQTAEQLNIARAKMEIPIPETVEELENHALDAFRYYLQEYWNIKNK